MSQGEFSWDDGPTRRDRALEQVEQEPFRTRIAVLIDNLDPGHYTGETIRELAELYGIRPHHFNAWGAAIMAAVRRGALTPTGSYSAAKAPKKHAHRNPVYERS